MSSSQIIIPEADSIILPEEIDRWSYNEKRMLKYMLEKDGIQFMRYFFKLE